LGSAANLNAPTGFIDLLIERVAAYLDLPDDRVRKMIEENAKMAREQAMQQGVPVASAGTEAGNLEDAVTGALATVTGPASGAPPNGPAPTEQAA
jgi:hypothetical protein